mmetsp:Transcript_68177/g.162761  ORF Transcript_68177/g.162761 Transcript_68177/m.162761 type:complete len:255 (-) Transcript_68177:72-836(-)
MPSPPVQYMPSMPQESRPAQYPVMGQFAPASSVLGNMPMPRWDGMPFLTQTLPPQDGQPQNSPGWQQGKYPAQMQQQVLVLSNFLEGPQKLQGQVRPMAEPQDRAPPQAPGITTLMLRNIPVTFNREALLADFDVRGFRGKYDFFYLPIDFQTDNNLGYAFVNFATPGFAENFRKTYQGLALAGDRSKKICAVAPATTQGRASNVEYYRNSNVMLLDDKYHPLVFENGTRAPFPSPTKAIKPVRYRESRGVQPE